MTTGQFGTGAFPVKARAGVARSRSTEYLQSLDHVTRKMPEPLTVKQTPVQRKLGDGKAKPISRVELLLLAKTARPVYAPEEDTTASQAVNQAIKSSCEWSQVQNIIASAPELTPSNLAFALYRLGCFQAFASKKRIADLKASNLVEKIFDQAIPKLAEMEPSSIVFLLDGCTRLQHQPTNNEFENIATNVQQNVHSMHARQLSLVLWAFMSLHYNPGPQVLLSLEDAVHRQASELSSQGMALVFSSFQAANHQLTDLTLSHLAEVIQRKLLLFKPSELATCLKALSTQGYTPSPSFLKAVIERNGNSAAEPLDENIPTVPTFAFTM